MKGPLRNGLMQFRGRLTKSGFGEFGVLVVQGGFHFLDHRLDPTQNPAIPLMAFHGLPGPFNCRLMPDGHTSPPHEVTEKWSRFLPQGVERGQHMSVLWPENHQLENRYHSCSNR